MVTVVETEDGEVPTLCPECHHTEPHTGGGIGVCLHKGCGCDGGPVPELFQVMRLRSEVSSVARILARKEKHLADQERQMKGLRRKLRRMQRERDILKTQAAAGVPYPGILLDEIVRTRAFAYRLLEHIAKCRTMATPPLLLEDDEKAMIRSIRDENS